ncbi:MAG: hypothetical protein HYY63_03375, partial [Elusimicrobia bacterium]|nr:hypothetical protein [Elusimicrobiota bacterium]
MEKILNFSKVEKERGAILRNLTKNLSRAQVQEFLNVSLGYRAGSIKHSDFYVYLKELCEKCGIAFKGYPAMDGYIRYVLLSDRIQAEKLLKEVKTMEERAYQILARTEEEKMIVTQSKYLYLVSKLLSSSLTREEWEEYETISVGHSFSVRHSGESGNLVGRKSVLDSRFRGNDGGRGNDNLTLSGYSQFDLKSFEDFYKESLIRDQKISENVLKKFSNQKQSSSNGPSVAVLVTGGFHSEGIEEILTRSNVAMVTFTPKITRVETDKGTAYLSVFTQEKTPLQKLFEGEKLFVSQEMLPQTTVLMTGMAVSAIHKPDNVEEANVWFHKLTHKVGEFLNMLRIRKRGNDLVVRMRAPNGEEVEADIQRLEDLSIVDITGGKIDSKTRLFAQIKSFIQKTLKKVSGKVILSSVGASIVFILMNPWAISGSGGWMSAVTFAVLLWMLHSGPFVSGMIPVTGVGSYAAWRGRIQGGFWGRQGRETYYYSTQGESSSHGLTQEELSWRLKFLARMSGKGTEKEVRKRLAGIGARGKRKSEINRETLFERLRNGSPIIDIKRYAVSEVMTPWGITDLTRLNDIGR